MSHTNNDGSSDGNSSVGRCDHIGLFFLLIRKVAGTQYRSGQRYRSSQSAPSVTLSLTLSPNPYPNPVSELSLTPPGHGPYNPNSHNPEFQPPPTQS